MTIFSFSLLSLNWWPPLSLHIYLFLCIHVHSYLPLVVQEFIHFFKHNTWRYIGAFLVIASTTSLASLSIIIFVSPIPLQMIRALRMACISVGIWSFGSAHSVWKSYEPLDHFLRRHGWPPSGGVFLLCIPEMQVRKRISECLAGPREWIYLSPGAISKEERVTNTLGERSTT